MTSLETLRTVVAEGALGELPPVIDRDIEIARVPNRAGVIIGPRRCGKTYRMVQHARELMAGGVPRSHMLFIDYEDDRLAPFGTRLIAETVDEFSALLQQRGERPDRLFLFLDEVQNVPEWGRQLRRILKDQRFEVIVSGSSAKMLSTEIATEFKGRGIATEMLPLSFREFLRFRGTEGLEDDRTNDARLMLRGEFEAYLRIGGFPEAQGLPERVRIQLLQQLASTIIAKDVCERHNLPPTGVVAFARQVLRTSGREFSANKAYHAMKSAHIPLARDTAFALPGLCEDAFLFFTVSQLARSYRVQKQGVRKVYAVDPGLQFAVSPASAEDLGQRLECAIYLQLRRGATGMRDGSIALYRTKDGREVDFAIGDAASEEASRLVQVAVNVEDADTARREYGALSAALDETRLDRGELVVLDATRALPPQDERIVVISAWDWFLR